MTRDQRRHERYAAWAIRNRPTSDVHGIIAGFWRAVRASRYIAYGIVGVFLGMAIRSWIEVVNAR